MVLYGLAPLLLARQLSPAEYGRYAVVMALTSLVAGLFQMGQHSALHKMLPEYAQQDRQRGGALLATLVSLTSGILLLFCAAFAGCAGWLAVTVYHDVALTSGLRFAVLLMLALTLFNLSASVVAGLQDFRAYNAAAFLRSLTFLLLAWCGAAWFGLFGALTGQLAGLLLGLALLAQRGRTLARRAFPGAIRADFSRASLRPLVAFAFPALLLTLLNLPAYWWINTLLARHQGYTEVALFSVSYALAQLIWLLPINLYVPVMTFLSEAQAAADQTAFARLVSDNLRAIWLVTLPLALGAAWFSPLLLRVLFGAAYEAAAPTVSFLSLTALLMSLVGLLNTALTAAGRIWHNVAITFVWTLLFGALSWYYVPRWGAPGGGMALALSQTVYLTMLAIYLVVGLRLRCHAAGRMTLLSLLGFAGLALALRHLTGPVLYVSGICWLAALAGAQWRWVCGELERRAVNKAVRGIRQAAHISWAS